MNRLEFKEVLKAVGVNNPLTDTHNRYGESEEVHYWKDIVMYFGGSYYTIIKGKIPFEVADIIYEKYPNNPYKIRIDGGSEDYKPIEYAIDKQYTKEIAEELKKTTSLEDFSTINKKLKKEMLKRDDDKKYISKYHIDTKEGLIILLTEMKDYYARKQELPEVEVQRFDEILSTVNTEILKKVNPNITTYEWMQEDKEYGKIFLSSISKDQDTPFGRTFRDIIEQFDKTINPYINEEIELDTINNYSKRVNISANVYNEEDGKFRKNCCKMIIKPKDEKNEVRYYRKPNGFSYQLMYTINPDEYLTVFHYFSDKGIKDINTGEYIYIYYDNDKTKQKINLRYNITQGLIEKANGERTSITSEEIIFIYNKLVMATNLAATITIDNMKKKGYPRKLVSDKK